MNKKWCNCKGHRTHDFLKLTDFYCSHFIPDGWELQCNGIDKFEENRYLYLAGKCKACDKFMRSGVSLPFNRKESQLIQCIWNEYRRHRPYDFYHSDTKCYQGGLKERSDWYSCIDHWSIEEQKTTFISLFQIQFQEQVKKWIDEYIK